MKNKIIAIVTVFTLSLPFLKAEEISLTDHIDKEKTDISVFDIFGDSEIVLSLEDAILFALKNNVQLKIQNMNVESDKIGIEQEKALYDPKIKASVASKQNKSKTLANGDLRDAKTDETVAQFEIEQLLENGATIGINAEIDKAKRSSNGGQLYENRLGIDYNQPLMRGAGRKINLISLREAELDYEYSKYELQAYLLSFVASVEKQYWEHYLSLKRLEIVNESMNLAVQQRKETDSRIRAGSIAESEMAAADAEVARCEEDTINAQSNVVNSAVNLLRSVNPDMNNFWKNFPKLTDTPFMKNFEAKSLEEHIAQAIKERPELKQARIRLKRNDLEIVATENGLLPKLDFFINLGDTGYSKSFRNSNPKLGHNGYPYDTQVGLSFETTGGRRAAKVKAHKAKLTKEISREALKNLEQLAKADVIKAYIEVQRTKKQIAATAATTEKQKEKLRVEEIKFNVGKTTSYQVSQAQRDLTEAKIAEIGAVIEYTNAITDLLRADGTSLLRAMQLEVK